MGYNMTRFSNMIKSSKVNGGYVFVDSCWTNDHGYETMAFRANGVSVLNWGKPIDVRTYDTEESMEIGHEDICKKWAD